MGKKRVNVGTPATEEEMAEVSRGVPGLHDTAMGLAEVGDKLRRLGHFEAAVQSFRGALKLERLAAEREKTEPSRGILFRSAAWLAREAGDPQESNRLAVEGLAGKKVNPRTRRELQEVAKKARAALRGRKEH